jgi:pimeloyl-ACP methyl ester carboxylesterase
MIRLAVADPSALGEDLALQIIPAMNAPGFVPTAMAGAAHVRSARPPRPACRTLLVWGRRDRILPLRAARELAASLPDAELRVLNDVGHCAMFERPALVNEILLGFLSSQAS